MSAILNMTIVWGEPSLDVAVFQNIGSKAFYEYYGRPCSNTLVGNQAQQQPGPTTTVKEIFLLHQNAACMRLLILLTHKPKTIKMLILAIKPLGRNCSLKNLFRWEWHPSKRAWRTQNPYKQLHWGLATSLLPNYRSQLRKNSHKHNTILY